MSKIKQLFGNIRGVGRLFTSGFGRKPDTHWAVLFSLFIIMVLAVIGWSTYVFYQSAAPAALGGADDQKSGSRTFDKRLFERVLEHFAEHEKRFKEIQESKTGTVDPS
jgi:hypothetical protein